MYTDIWKAKVEETSFLYVTPAHEKSKRQAAEVEQTLQTTKQCFLANLCDEEKGIFQTHILKYSASLQNNKSKFRKQKILHKRNRFNHFTVTPADKNRNDIATELDGNDTLINDAPSTNDTNVPSEDVGDIPSGRKRRNRRWISKSKYRRIIKSKELSDAAKSLLNKGLNFCPLPKGINTSQRYADMFRMERNSPGSIF